jgi:phenylalanyl-tRNA synthetase alpha chain
MKVLLTQEAVNAALSLSDLTEQSARPHAIHLMVEAILAGLAKRNWPEAEVKRGPRVVSAAENYGLLGYDSNEITLGSAHTRWVSPTTLLRTQTTSLIPSALQAAAQTRRPGELVLIAAPGITYRRDERDRLHCGEPHQMDVWVLGDPDLASPERLLQLVKDILDTAVPSCTWTHQSSPHHYTEQGIEVNVDHPDKPVEVLECGLMATTLLQRLGIDPTKHAGLALGMGLDRLVMLRKGVPDIRLLRDADKRIAAQMLDLEPWRPVSRQPATQRDMSLALSAGYNIEDLTERVLGAAGEQQRWIETVEVRGRWAYDAVPEVARQRLGLLPGQENVLVRVVLRDWASSISKEEGNALYTRLQETLHEGEQGGGYKLS